MKKKLFWWESWRKDMTSKNICCLFNALIVVKHDTFLLNFYMEKIITVIIMNIRIIKRNGVHVINKKLRRASKDIRRDFISYSKGDISSSKNNDESDREENKLKRNCRSGHPQEPGQVPTKNIQMPVPSSCASLFEILPRGNMVLSLQGALHFSNTKTYEHTIWRPYVISYHLFNITSGGSMKVWNKIERKIMEIPAGVPHVWVQWACIKICREPVASALCQLGGRSKRSWAQKENTKNRKRELHAQTV